MPQSIKAIYEDGVLKPLEEINLKEHQKIEIILKSKKSAVDRTKGIIKADQKTIEEVALSPEYEMEL